MIVDRPWHHFNISTKDAFSDHGNKFLSEIRQADKLTILESKDFKLFNPDWITKVSAAIQNQLASIMIFYRPAQMQWPAAHIDVNTNLMNESNTIKFVPSAINLIYNGINDDSEMVWYDCPEIKETDVQWTVAKTAYLDYDPASLTEISRCCIGTHLTLVRADIPHNIIMGDVPRLSISMRFTQARWQDPSWEGIVKQCENYLKIED